MSDQPGIEASAVIDRLAMQNAEQAKAIAMKDAYIAVLEAQLTAKGGNDE